MLAFYIIVHKIAGFMKGFVFIIAFVDCCVASFVLFRSKVQLKKELWDFLVASTLHSWKVLKILIYSLTSTFLFTFYPYYKDILAQNEKFKSFFVIFTS